MGAIDLTDISFLDNNTKQKLDDFVNASHINDTAFKYEVSFDRSQIVKKHKLFVYTQLVYGRFQHGSHHIVTLQGRRVLVTTASSLQTTLPCEMSLLI